MLNIKNKFNNLFSLKKIKSTLYLINTMGEQKEN